LNAIKPTFIGSVLKAIACTPNLKLDHDNYQRLVAQPTQQIRSLSKTLEGHMPEPVKVREIMSQLRDMLDAKGIDLDERQDHLREIIELHLLQEPCADLLETVTAAAS